MRTFCQIFQFLITFIILSSCVFGEYGDNQQAHHEKQISISHVTLLLPALTSSSNVKFLLKATGGCFRQNVLNDDIIDISLAQSNCTRPDSSESVQITVKSPAERGRRSTWIVAEHIGLVGRAECEVYVDVIRRLEILTSTRIINVGDTETLNIQAFDENENVFSTVEGLPFRWHNDNKNILREVSFSDAAVTISEENLIESGGQISSRLPLRGISTGKTVVTAHLEDSSHNCSQVGVRFSVVEPIYLSPSYLRIPPVCDFKFRLQTRYLRNSMYQRIVHDVGDDKLPDFEQSKNIGSDVGVPSMNGLVPILNPQQNYFQSSETMTFSTPIEGSEKSAAIIDIDHRTGEITSIGAGRAKISVQNKEIEMHKRQSDVIIEVPAKIDIAIRQLTPKLGDQKTISNMKHQFLVYGRQYEFKIDMFSGSGQKLEVSNCTNIKFDIHFSNTGIVSSSVDTESKRRFIIPRIFGSTLVNVSLNYIASQRKPKLSTHFNLFSLREITVCDQIQIENKLEQIAVSETFTGKISSELDLHHYYKRFVLPQTCQNHLHIYKLMVVGGSQTYRQVSHNTDIVSIDNSGQAKSRSIGRSAITVSDKYNIDNSITLIVDICRVGSIGFSKGRRDVSVGNRLDLVVEVVPKCELTFTGDNNTPLTQPQQPRFSNCSGLKLKPTLEQSSIIQNNILNSNNDSNIIDLPFEPTPKISPLKGTELLNAISSSSQYSWFNYSVKSRHAGIDFALVDTEVCYDDSINRVLPGRTQIAAHSGLVVWPDPIIIAEGHTRIVRVEGGPRDQGKELTTQIFFEDSEKLSELKDFNKLKNNGQAILEKQQINRHWNEFQLKCNKQHNQTIEIKVSNQESSMRDSVSTLKKVQLLCFPPLQFVEEAVFVGVGTNKKPQLMPHPLLHSVNYRIEDGGVASVDQNGSVVGKLLGNTRLHAYVNYFGENIDKNEKISRLSAENYATNSKDYDDFLTRSGLHDSIAINVQFQGFRIRLPVSYSEDEHLSEIDSGFRNKHLTRLLEGEQVVADLEGINGEVPGSHNFPSVINWTSEILSERGENLSEDIVINLQHPFDERLTFSSFESSDIQNKKGNIYEKEYKSDSTTYFSTEFKGPSVRISAINPGEVQLVAKVVMKNSKLLAKNVELEQKQRLVVVPKFKLLSPDEIILTKNAIYDIETNRPSHSLTYSINFENPKRKFANKVVEVSKHGRLHALENGNAVILIRSNYQNVEQFVTLRVLVRPIAGLFLKQRLDVIDFERQNKIEKFSSFVSGQAQNYLCSGMKVDIEIYLTDTNGRIFDSVVAMENIIEHIDKQQSQIKVLSNNNSVVSVDIHSAKRILSYRNKSVVASFSLSGLNVGFSIVKIDLPSFEIFTKNSDIDKHSNTYLSKSILVNVEDSNNQICKNEVELYQIDLRVVSILSFAQNSVQSNAKTVEVYQTLKNCEDLRLFYYGLSNELKLSIGQSPSHSSLFLIDSFHILDGHLRLYLLPQLSGSALSDKNILERFKRILNDSNSRLRSLSSSKTWKFALDSKISSGINKMDDDSSCSNTITKISKIRQSRSKLQNAMLRIDDQKQCQQYDINQKRIPLENLQTSDDFMQQKSRNRVEHSDTYRFLYDSKNLDYRWSQTEIDKPHTLLDIDQDIDNKAQYQNTFKKQRYQNTFLGDLYDFFVTIYDYLGFKDVFGGVYGLVIAFLIFVWFLWRLLEKRRCINRVPESSSSNYHIWNQDKHYNIGPQSNFNNEIQKQRSKLEKEKKYFDSSSTRSQRFFM